MKGAKLFPERTCRQRPTRWFAARVIKAQEGRCRGCGTAQGAFDMDHIVPLGLGGANDPGNWAALCAPCHRKKTGRDLRMIAKAERQRRFQELGKGRAPRHWTPFPGHAPNTFSKEHRRHMNGTVSKRCACGACQAARRGVDG